MHITRRNWLAAAALAGVPAILATGGSDSASAQESPTKKQSKAEPAATPEAAAPAAPPAPGELTVESLGNLLQALGLKPKRTETRYDFSFASKQQDEEWTLTMSAVLSADNKTIWIMAWLDELPRAARDVPRTALLRLLAENDKMGKGKFFSYISANRRFALQQVVDNRDMTSKRFRSILVELGQTVAFTYPQWSVAGWKEATPGTGSSAADDTDTDTDDEAEDAPVTKASATRAATAPKGAVPAQATAAPGTARIPRPKATTP